MYKQVGKKFDLEANQVKLKVSVVELCVCLFLMLFSLAPLCLAADEN